MRAEHLYAPPQPGPEKRRMSKISETHNPKGRHGRSCDNDHRDSDSASRENRWESTMGRRHSYRQSNCNQ